MRGREVPYTELFRNQQERLVSSASAADEEHQSEDLPPAPSPAAAKQQQPAWIRDIKAKRKSEAETRAREASTQASTEATANAPAVAEAEARAEEAVRLEAEARAEANVQAARKKSDAAARAEMKLPPAGKKAPPPFAAARASRAREAKEKEEAEARAAAEAEAAAAAEADAVDYSTAFAILCGLDDDDFRAAGWRLTRTEHTAARTVAPAGEVIAPAAPDIAALVALGSELVQPPREDVEAAPPLAAARRAELEALWSLLSPNIETPVRLEVLRSAEKGGKIGPHSVSVLKELYAMDANADGLLSWSELESYFTAAGAALSDEEFTFIVGDMRERIQT